MLRTSGDASGVMASRAVGAVPLSTLRNMLAWPGRAAATISLWTERTRQRGALAALDDRLLRDVGLTRVRVWQEVSKPFWRA